MAMFRESSLADSKIYQDLKNLTGKNQTERAIDLIKRSKLGSSTVKELAVEDIETSYIQLKQYSNTLYRAALKSFENGVVKLIYNSDSLATINKAIPFLTFKNNEKWTTYVFADNYVTLDRKNNVMTFPPDRLRDLLIGGMIGNALKRDYSKLATNPFLQKITMELYTKFVCRILGKDYSLLSNKELYDKTQYWLNKFFLLNVFNATDHDNNIENLAKKDIRYLNEMEIAEMKNQYDESNPSSFEDMLLFLRDKHISLKNIGISSFLNSWLNYYYAPSLLALENMEYLIFMIIVLLHGTHSIINISAQPIVADTKNIKSFGEELLKLL